MRKFNLSKNADNMRWEWEDATRLRNFWRTMASYLTSHQTDAYGDDSPIIARLCFHSPNDYIRVETVSADP